MLSANRSTIRRVVAMPMRAALAARSLVHARSKRFESGVIWSVMSIARLRVNLVSRGRAADGLDLPRPARRLREPRWHIKISGPAAGIQPCNVRDRNPAPPNAYERGSAVALIAVFVLGGPARCRARRQAPRCRSPAPTVPPFAGRGDDRAPRRLRVDFTSHQN